MGYSVKPRNLVEPIMFIYMLIVFLQYPAIQSLFYSKICLQNFNETVCKDLSNSTYKAEESFVQRNTSHWILYLNLVLLVPSVFSAMILGRIGDRVSRKSAILSPIIGQFLCSLGYLLNALYIRIDLLYVLIGPFILGISGGFPTFLMGIYSYLSHTTEKEKRTVRMGIIEALTYFSATLAFLMVGVLMDNFGFVPVFGLIFSLTVVVLVYTIFVIEDITPETDLTKKEAIRAIFSMQGYQDFAKFFRKTREKKQNLILLLGIFVICIIMFITAADIDLAILYLFHPPLSLSKSYVSYFLTLDNILKAVALLIFLPLFKKYFKISDCFWAILGFISKSVGSFLFGTSHVASLTFCVPVVRMFQGFPSAVIRALVSSTVENTEQGQLFAVVASSESIVTIIAAVIYNPLYAATVDIDPGICFYIAGVFALIGIILIGIIWKLSADRNTYKHIVEENVVVRENEVNTVNRNEITNT